MPVAFINVGSGASVTLGTALTLTYPGLIIPGNFLLGFTNIATASTPVWPAGWTAVGAGFCAYRIADGTETPGGSGPNITFSSSTNIGWIGQWTSVLAIGATTDNQSTTGTTASNTGVTTTANLSYILSCVVESANAVPSLPTGLTNNTTASTGSPVAAGFRLSQEIINVSGTATGALNSTVTSSPWRNAVIELKLLAGLTRAGMESADRKGSRG